MRIAAHAFGDGRPERDLLVSPGHGLCVDVLGEVPVPAGRLVNGTSVPAHVVPGSTDERRLAVCLAALTLDDGLTGRRTIALDDPLPVEGFHALDGEGEARWRRTDGAALLPEALWEGCRGTLFLRVGLSCPALPRWIGPREAAGVVDLAGFRRPV